MATPTRSRSPFATNRCISLWASSRDCLHVAVHLVAAPPDGVAYLWVLASRERLQGREKQPAVA